MQKPASGWSRVDGVCVPAACLVQEMTFRAEVGCFPKLDLAPPPPSSSSSSAPSSNGLHAHRAHSTNLARTAHLHRQYPVGYRIHDTDPLFEPRSISASPLMLAPDPTWARHRQLTATNHSNFTQSVHDATHPSRLLCISAGAPRLPGSI
jgi:hypothetical protein